MTRRATFLDRDGTINVDIGNVHRVEQWQWTDRAIEAIRLLNERDFVVAVVTNQSAIAAGRYSLSDVETLQARVQEELKEHSAHVDYFAVCPHSEQDACTCRKPLTGLATEIEQALGQAIDYCASWTIGDKVSDVEFGTSLGTHTGLIRSNYWSPEDLHWPPDIIKDSLFDCVGQILGREYERRPTARSR